MSINDTSRNGSMPTTVEGSTEPVPSNEPNQARESTVLNGRHEPSQPSRHELTQREWKDQQEQTRPSRRRAGRCGSVLCVHGFSRQIPEEANAGKAAVSAGQSGVDETAQGSVTPVMDTVRTPAPDNSNGQLGPSDIGEHAP